MDIKALRSLTKLMNDNGLIELEVESNDMKVKMSKAGTAVAPAAVVAAPVVAAPAAASAPAAVEPAGEDFSGCTAIKSPIPGTAYLRPNPDSPLFVKVGDTINEGDVVCLVEAMKVFNEIKAQTSGVVKKVCVEDSQAVEYDSDLFLIG